MPNEWFIMGQEPQGLHLGCTTTVQAPADSSSTTPVLPNEPLRWARTGTAGTGRQAVRCTAGQLPEMYSLERNVMPGFPIGVRLLKPRPTAGDAGRGAFIEKLAYSGTPPAAADLSVAADGLGGWQIVAAAAGVGTVIAYSGGYMGVIF